MTLQEFQQLHEEQQFDLLEQEGVLLAEREAAFCTVRLFQLGAIYIELYHHTHFNVIVRLHSFTSTKGLEAYLERIDISELFSA